MNFNLIAIFRSVMQQGTITAAAKYAGMSQPAVSKAIKKLESDVGFPLFERFGKSMVPTDLARILYSESESVFLLARAFDRTVVDLRNCARETLKISATPQLGHTVLPEAISLMIAQNQGVQIYLDVQQSGNIIDILGKGAADIGFAIALEDKLRASLEMVAVGSVELVCLVPRGHELVDRAEIRPTDLSGHRFIGLEMGSRLGPVISNAFRDAGVPYRSSVEVRYSETACLLARAGAGIAIVDQFSASNLMAASEEFRAIPFRPTVLVEAFAVTLKGAHPRRLTRVLIEIVRDLIKKRQFSSIGIEKFSPGS
ncbi:hypothetical protein CDEF62S_01621 [Castellaniella defragrans]